MIIGRNYYEESQKLFSTGNEDLDAILEEVYYSGIEDGYDYAQKEFAEKTTTRKERKELVKAIKKEKLSKEDLESILARARMAKSTNEDVIKANEGDKEAAKRLINRDKKILRVGSAATGGVSGAIMGSTAGPKGALIGAGVGTAAGLAIGHLAGKGAEKQQKKHGNDKRYETDNKISDDYSRVALGKMTPKEFKDKWGGGFYSK